MEVVINKDIKLFMDAFYSDKNITKKEKDKNSVIKNNIKIFNETLNIIKNDGNTEMGEINYKISTKIESTKYTIKDVNLESLKTYNYPKIEVLNIDCIYAASIFAYTYKVCILNMASRKYKGGGVKTGARAQEETICRRSNLYFGLENIKYPFKHEEAYLTSRVCFFRHSVDLDYKLYECPFYTNVVSMAGYNINEGETFTDEGMKLKIQTLLSVAASSGSEIIILSALGCGAYKNSPDKVATLFNQILNELNYKYLFRYIIFAIIDDHNSKSNFSIFNSIINTNS